VTQNGRALEFVSDLLKTDHETVVAAVTQWRGASKYANHVLYDLLVKEVLSNAGAVSVRVIG